LYLLWGFNGSTSLELDQDSFYTGNDVFVTQTVPK